MSGVNAPQGAAPSRHRTARAIGTAVAVVLAADVAVALVGSPHLTVRHHHDAVPVRPLADVAPITAPAPAVAQTVDHDAQAAHRAAMRRVAAAEDAQAARRQAKANRQAAAAQTAAIRHAATSKSSTTATATTPTATTTASHVGTVVHSVRSTATTPGVKPDEVGTVTTGAVVRGTAPKSDLKKIPALTYLATMRHRAPGYSSATAKRPSMKVPRNWYGRTSVLPILDATTKRVEVRLSRRPNESSTWLKLSAVNLGFSRQAILIDISQRRLYVFRNGKQKYSFPVGVGRPQTPTPTGTFFLAFHAPPNSPEYGSVMLETSAHSTVFKTFEGGNDAIIAIHGPIGSDAAIGNHGAAISNGCIRMHDPDLRKAAHVEDGSPIILAH